MAFNRQLPFSSPSSIGDLVDARFGGDLHRIVLDGIRELPSQFSLAINSRRLPSRWRFDTDYRVLLLVLDLASLQPIRS